MTSQLNRLQNRLRDVLYGSSLAGAGEITGGIAEENGGRQNITFNIGPGQSMLVPQGTSIKTYMPRV